MNLYIEDSLEYIFKSKPQTNELRGGKYAARIQIGYEKDGSPKYRYFETQEEYERYLQGHKGKKKDSSDSKKKDKKKSKDKDKKKDSESKNKKKQSMLLVGSKSKKSETTNKSIRLYLGDSNE